MAADDDDGKIDASVVAALYVEYGDQLRRFLTGVLRDPQLAADVMQTTFARLVERGHETREGSRKAWLFQVAYREALAVRRRQGVGERVVRRVAWSRDACQLGVDEALIRLELVETVRHEIEKLPEAQQQVLRKRIYEEMTFEDIARELGIPLGTALGRMRTALCKLRARLNSSENSEDSEP